MQQKHYVYNIKFNAVKLNYKLFILVMLSQKLTTIKVSLKNAIEKQNHESFSTN